MFNVLSINSSPSEERNSIKSEHTSLSGHSSMAFKAASLSLGNSSSVYKLSRISSDSGLSGLSSSD